MAVRPAVAAPAPKKTTPAPKPAAPKPAPSKAPPKASKSTSIAAWDAELAAMAEMQAGQEAALGGSNWLSVRAGVMTHQGNDVPNNKLQAIIPISVFENAWYDGPFDPENPKSPACFALSEDGTEMVPHEKSPNPQHTQCGTQGQPDCCPQNEFGSADRGRGKACKNIRRLALFAADEVVDAESAAAAVPAFLKVPVTSVKGWSSYVQTLKNTIRRPTMAVTTEISCRPDPKNQVMVSFRLLEEISDSTITRAIKERIAKLKEFLLAPYTPFEEAEEAPAPKRKTKRKY